MLSRRKRILTAFVAVQAGIFAIGSRPAAAAEEVPLCGAGHTCCVKATNCLSLMYCCDIGLDNKMTNCGCSQGT